MISLRYVSLESDWQEAIGGENLEQASAFSSDLDADGNDLPQKKTHQNLLVLVGFLLLFFYNFSLLLYKQDLFVLGLEPFGY